MATVKCKWCDNLKDNKCTAKKSGGKHPSVKINSNRNCDKYTISADGLIKEADKAYAKSQVPIFAPTWRYYASKKELKELGEEKGAKFVRINPDVR